MQRRPDPERRSHTWPGSPLARVRAAVATLAAAALVIPSSVSTPGDTASPSDETPIPAALAAARVALPALAPLPTLAAPTAPAAPAPQPAAEPAAVVPAPGKGSAALAAAMSARGTPYRWGGTGKGGFDCSGLAQWAYRKAGVTLPRTSRAQSSVGTPVSKGDLRPGDLVFFYRPVSHVGIYVGNGNVVHAVGSGDVVRVSPLARMPYSGARRL